MSEKSETQPYNIRLATSEDIPYIINLSRKLKHLTPYRVMSFSEVATRAAIETCLSEGLVLLSDSGILAALVITPHFSETRVASELLWYSFAQGSDKILEEQALLEAFEYWALNVAGVDTIITGSFGLPRSLAKRGYQQCETSWIYRSPK